MPQLGSDDGTEKLHKNLDLEIRDMISTLTNRLTNLQRLQKTMDHDNQEDLEVDRGVRIITLAGNNVGATMRGEIEDKNATGANPSQVPPLGEDETLSTYVNSNFQAINNSIMMGGSYTTQDPGVHMDISDYLDNKPSLSSSAASHPSHNHGKKEKKKHSGSSKSDHQPEMNSE
ncbi:OLC1v1024567C1 [Oldenlandia corymbosa var. corymbosa]|uniref:OLC1v1024567C1 n=1 Tax=Oldenlandia corymbosa var. corymbosa TaxID=529605 RepID=A0AAV1C342_OLDCO|nr:OLC1v1024567C1 [Oldenlandia corymbosa var. corymbosa]